MGLLIPICPSGSWAQEEAESIDMAKKSLIVKASRAPKYTVRGYNRCKLCGRPRAYIRKFGVCRICFRELASNGKLPGVTKASW